MSAAPVAGNLRGPMLLMTGSSAMLPLIGLVSAPVLARGLGADGRGLIAAAGAPGTLLTGLAALGLPEALTYFVAKNPTFARRLMMRALLLTVALGCIAVGVIVAVSPVLAYGNAELAPLILVATLLAVPQLLIGVLRGTATGLQLWHWVAIERLVGSGGRLLVLILLLVTGTLTPWSAVLTVSLSGVVSGIVYLPLATQLRRVGAPVEPVVPFREVAVFGTRIWAGAIAGIVLSRIGQILFVPFASVDELGLLIVAITISDVPLLITFAVRDALYGVSSKTTNADQVARTTRFSLILTAGICLIIGGTLPLWIAPLFGADFDDAILPTWLLLLSALVSVPGYLAAAGLGAWGKPGLRSIGLAGTLLVYVVAFLALVPSLGAIGAGWASIAAGLFSTVFMMFAARQILNLPVRHFLVPRSTDFMQFWQEGFGLVKKVLGVLPIGRS